MSTGAEPSFRSTALVLADGEAVCVMSANLDEVARDGNREIGLLIRDRQAEPEVP
jgi:hypothetical protein